NLNILPYLTILLDFIYCFKFILLSVLIALEVIILNQSNKNQNILSSLSYFSVFLAPIIFTIFVWIFADKLTSTNIRKALFNHIWVYIFLFFANLGFIFSREVFDKPFDNQEVISNVSFGIGIFLLLIAGIIFLFNIIRGIKLLTDK